jgi:hypothetical protein
MNCMIKLSITPAIHELNLTHTHFSRLRKGHVEDHSWAIFVITKLVHVTKTWPQAGSLVMEAESICDLHILAGPVHSLAALARAGVPLYGTGTEKSDPWLPHVAIFGMRASYHAVGVLKYPVSRGQEVVTLVQLGILVNQRGWISERLRHPIEWCWWASYQSLWKLAICINNRDPSLWRHLELVEESRDELVLEHH